ncbi:MAG: succinate dehydrogenase assembly factor 2 [Candidatus Competibacteraceae bacterium]|nr:succinate dehydrogenase assembly factor 2 [Candidatus Competibacteraceae bacterium]
MDEQMGKLRWRCRRGMKELDLLTLGYLEQYYPDAAAEDQQAFADLLELQDPLLMSYMVGRGNSGGCGDSASRRHHADSGEILCITSDVECASAKSLCRP